jgi:uncharacterized protein (TIGR03032 family)
MAEMTADNQLRSVHTPSFGAILADRGISLLVSTYQAGRLVVLRHDGRGGVNTHFHELRKPMGVALTPDGVRLAIGTKGEVREYRDAPAVAPHLDRPGGPRHDAAYLPRVTHVTGDVLVHEMAWAGDGELWFANTRFSCLCTRSERHSFQARWRPPFITALAAEDRCHLNGLAMVDGRPRYVTALGRTDTQGGWRADKRAGGVLLEVPSGDVVAAGLAMPHSPRVVDGSLWVLESGTGGIGRIHPATGRFDPIASLPGFTRGLDFHGPLAFVGLSKVRETAHFGDLPITQVPVDQRACGVWVVDVHTGRTVAFLRFEAGVREIFAVTVVPRRCPELVDGEDLRDNAFNLPDVAPVGGV